ncbi:glutamyl-tRNA reductase [Sulfurimonas sp. HSL-1716]|uniref:glutamyl-tRNA reductase n=1 Tax=Hydrocurvibacter sulfurireducens TaxID=3131937 RepID=UPI0031F88DC9
MHYLTISFTHKNSTIEIREKLSFSNDEQLKDCLAKLNSSEAIHESILISTCNRMEVLVSCSSVMTATKHIFKLLNERSGISEEELEGRADIFDDQGAIHHLFSVASSLDSLVIGETQIAGQLKDAFRFSYDNNFCGQKLSRAMHYAFKCAAAVRNVTNISSKPVSIASVAVTKLRDVLKDIEGKKALVIGVGEMSEITAKHLASNGVEVYIVNRTRESAEDLAVECGAKVKDFSELSDLVNQFEILFTATSSKEPIITDAIIKNCDFERFWFDMALPRDISFSHGENINLFVIDDLKSIVNENMTIREDEAKRSYAIIGRQTMQFYEWLRSLSVEPIIKEIYNHAHKAAQEETNRVISNGYIPKEYEKEILKMNEQVLKRFLHDITHKIRQVSGEANADTMIESIKFLLRNEKSSLLDKYKCEYTIKG